MGDVFEFFGLFRKLQQAEEEKRYARAYSLYDIPTPCQNSRSAGVHCAASALQCVPAERVVGQRVVSYNEWALTNNPFTYPFFFLSL